MQNSSIVVALKDIHGAFKRITLIMLLGWLDVKQRYRRSSIGPFWLTISMGVMIGTIGIVFGSIFGSSSKEFLPFLAAGIILWTYIASVISDGCSGFISAERIIKQLDIPLPVHIFRLIWKNILILFHNIVILPIVFLFVGKHVSFVIFLAIPGFILLTVNLAWMALVFSVICARYRDLPQIVGSILQVFFYLTPIMWMPHLMPQRFGAVLLKFNPFFHLLEIIRAPLLSGIPRISSWAVCILMALIGWGIALTVFGYYKRRIAYWL